ncbi:hypothetical protein FOZ62_023644, partial [Perkinsus olseni]
LVLKHKWTPVVNLQACGEGQQAMSHLLSASRLLGEVAATSVRRIIRRTDVVARTFRKPVWSAENLDNSQNGSQSDEESAEESDEEVILLEDDDDQTAGDSNENVAMCFYDNNKSEDDSSDGRGENPNYEIRSDEDTSEAGTYRQVKNEDNLKINSSNDNTALAGTSHDSHYETKESQQVDDSNTHISPEIPDAPAEAHPEKGEGPGDNEVLRSSAGEAAYAAAFAVKVEGAHEDVRRHPIEVKQQTSTQPPSFKLPKDGKITFKWKSG